MIERPHRFEDPRLRVAAGLGVVAGRRLAGEDRRHLQQVILHDVPNGTGLFVEPLAASDAEALGHGDLHALDVVAVPDRLEKRVREAEVQQILHRFFAEIVIDAEDARLGEGLMQRAVEGLCRGEVVAEGFFDDDPCVFRAARLRQSGGDGSKQRRWNGEIVQRPRSVTQRLPQVVERCRVLVVAGDVLQIGGKLSERLFVNPAVFVQTVAGPRPKVIEVPGPGHADDRDIEVTTLDHRLQRRKDLLVGEVARDAEDNQCIRGGCHPDAPFSCAAPISRWPPNPCRIADRSLSAKSASPRELKRSYSAALRTGVGIASSIAAAIVQRPSPESDTRPA